MGMNYQSTMRACFVGYIVQAIVNNFLPLLFLTLQAEYSIPLSKITLLITLNFMLQLGIDLASAVFIDKIGYRAAAVAAHVFAAAGLVMLTVLPGLFSDAFIGLLIAVMVYAVGGGLLEVLVSPIVEACPTPNKEKAMSMLHSFYCWGSVGVIGLSTLFFMVFGIENWRILALVWAAIPVVNAVVFARVPIAPLAQEGEKGLSILQLFKNKLFLLMCLLMLCAGASELSVSQWASAFAESGLGVSKTVGDLAGPMLFAVFMGISRLFYGKFGHKIRLESFMLLSGVLCVASYLLITLTGNALVGFIGCALCGLSVGIMWPGTFSLTAAGVTGGGTAMFAIMALFGDLGCTVGPSVVGFVSDRAGGGLETGILAAVVFPAVMCAGVLFLLLRRKRRAR